MTSSLSPAESDWVNRETSRRDAESAAYTAAMQAQTAAFEAQRNAFEQMPRILQAGFQALAAAEQSQSPAGINLRDVVAYRWTDETGRVRHLSPDDVQIVVRDAAEPAPEPVEVQES